MASLSSDRVVAEPGMFRMLHWVFKIGSLKSSLHFYEDILGMHVLRHEEFGNGCDATCNGPYARPWSKTMIGWGPEKSNFVFELTYNYGIKKYTHGNDLRHIAISASPVLENAARHNYPVEIFDGHKSLVDPDGYRWILIEDTKPKHVHHVSLNTPSLQKAIGFWHDTLGMARLESGDRFARFGYDPEQTALEYVESSVASVDHGAAFGRLAIATAPGTAPIHKAVVATGDKIQHGPIKLDTPGKATVEVIILADRDGYEVCYVEMDSFDELSKPVEGADKIDWKFREEYGGK